MPATRGRTWEVDDGVEQGMEREAVAAERSPPEYRWTAMTVVVVVVTAVSDREPGLGGHGPRRLAQRGDVRRSAMAMKMATIPPTSNSNLRPRHSGIGSSKPAIRLALGASPRSC